MKIILRLAKMKILISLTKYMCVVLVFIFLTILFSCQKRINKIVNEDIIFVDEQNDDLWIGTLNIPLVSFKEYIAVLTEGEFSWHQYLYDENTKEIWIVLYGRGENQDIASLYKVDNNNIDVDNFIDVSSKNKYIFINDLFSNTIIYKVDYISEEHYQKGYHIYILENILTSEKKEISLSASSFSVVGFCNNRIITNHGYYDIDRVEFVSYPFFDIYNGYWWNIRPSSDRNRIVGLNKKNEIMIYDLKTKEVTNTKIKRKKLGGLDYTTGMLYYLHGDYLYYSKDVFEKRILLTPLLLNNSLKPSVEWYRYDLKTGETVMIKTPANSVSILGIR